MCNLCHMHVHSEYSSLDGYIKIPALVKKAIEFGQPAVSITDHGFMGGLLELFKECEAHNKVVKKQIIKPIIGAELYIVNDRTQKVKGESNKHLLVHARNQVGYKNLLKLHYEGYATGATFVYDRLVPRIDRTLLSRETCKGLLATTGCLGSEINQLLKEDKWQEAIKLAEYYKGIFDAYFAELQPSYLIGEEQAIANDKIIKLAEMIGIPLICTTDSHYLTKEERDEHQLILAIQSKKDIYDEARFTFDATPFLSTEEMLQHFQEKVIANTEKMAEMCEYPEFLRFAQHGYRLPKYPIIDSDEFTQWRQQHSEYASETEAYKYCLHLVEKSWDKKLKFLKDNKELEGKYRERLATEFEVIKKMGFIDYFLIVQDFVGWCKQNDIMTGPGRGSAAGSLLAYLLGITKVDPIKYDLLFSRFLNADRVSLPDIDMDIDKARRDEVKEYLASKYGTDRVASIATFSTMKVRACIKDVVRSLKLGGDKAISFEIADKINKTLEEEEDNISFEEALAKPEFKKYMEEYPEVARYIQKFEGLIRQTGIHAAGVIIGAEPLTDTIPLMVDKNGVVATAYDGATLEKDGFLKVDLLGLKNLTIITDTLKNVEKTRGYKFRGFYTKGIDYIDDETTECFEDRLKQASEGKQMASRAYQIMREGRCNGLFQIESQTMRALLKGVAVNDIEDIAAVLALCRPGPLASGQTTEFGKRKRSGEDRDEWYKHSSLKPILQKTYSLIVYQEQCMQIAVQCAGFTEPEADTLRKCIRKGSLVQMADGRRLAIENVNAGDTVCSIDEHGNSTHSRVVNVYNNGRRELVRVITNKGVVDVTSDHKFYTAIGWKTISELQKGSYIAFPSVYYHIKDGLVSNKRRWQKHHLRVLGYLIGDGCTIKSTPVFFNKNEEIIKDYEEAVAQLMGWGKNRSNEACKEATHFLTGSKSIRPSDLTRERMKIFCQKMQLFGKGASEKSIPEEIFQYPNTYLCNLIGTLYATDGCIETNGKISYSSTSQQLIIQLISLLLRFGIQGYYTSRQNKEKPEITYYEVLVTDATSKKRFQCAFANYIIGPKGQKLKDMVYEGNNQSDADLVPIEFSSLIQSRINRSLLSTSELERELKYTSNSLNFYSGKHRGCGYNKARLRQLAIDLQDNILFSLSCNDMQWVPIRDIIQLNEEDEVYDLEIDDTHCFVVNNFLVHNCIGKKIYDQLAEFREKFVQGCMTKSKIDKLTAEAIFEDILAFAAYGFNKSHAIGYAHTTYECSYLKANFPAEFFGALLSSESDQVKVNSYIREASTLNIKILPVNINKSTTRYEVESINAIRRNLTTLKNVGGAAVEDILSKRPFIDMVDFLTRTDSKRVTSRVIEALIKAGAFEGAFADEKVPRKTYFDFYDDCRKKIKRFIKRAQEKDVEEGRPERSQEEIMKDFPNYNWENPVNVRPKGRGDSKETVETAVQRFTKDPRPEWGPSEIVSFETEIYGAPVTFNIFDFHASAEKLFKEHCEPIYYFDQSLDKYCNEDTLHMMVIIKGILKKTVYKKDAHKPKDSQRFMRRFLVEDRTGEGILTVFDKTFVTNIGAWKNGNMLILECAVNVFQERKSLIVNKVLKNCGGIDGTC